MEEVVLDIGMYGDVDLQNISYTELIMKETTEEIALKESAQALSSDERDIMMIKLEETYYKRRLVNAEYFKHLTYFAFGITKT